MNLLRMDTRSFQEAVTFFAVLFLIPAPRFAEPTPAEIVRRVESRLQGKTSQGRYEITIVRPRISRTLVIDSWGDTDGKKSFLRIISPKKDRGITFLKWDQNLWQYIPKIGKEIKIEGSLLQDSWMGSDFTNDDLVRSTSIVDDYDQAFVTPPDTTLYRVELKPKPGSPVVWNRVLMDVRKTDLMPVMQSFYDHRDRLVRVMEYSDFATMGGRYIPTHLVVKSIKNGREQSRTEMVFKNVRFDVPIPDSVFSRANLRR